MQIEIFPIPALKDNYIWALHLVGASECVVVDPGEAQPVMQALSQKGLSLDAILITHHHWDHTQGIEALLRQKSVPVFGPRQEQSKISALTHPIQGGEHFQLLQGSLVIQALSIPGHTLGHLAYYAEPVGLAPLLFCGDTLFGGGCGKIFEGTTEQLYSALLQLKTLPEHTQIYCGHEYTLNNLHFAHELEPEYLPVQARLQAVQMLRKQQYPTLPSTLEEEKRTNPFLRCDTPSLMQAVLKRFPDQKCTPLEIFRRIRQFKDAWGILEPVN